MADGEGTCQQQGEDGGQGNDDDLIPSSVLMQSKKATAAVSTVLTLQLRVRMAAPTTMLLDAVTMLPMLKTTIN